MIGYLQGCIGTWYQSSLPGIFRWYIQAQSFVQRHQLLISKSKHLFQRSVWIIEGSSETTQLYIRLNSNQTCPRPQSGFSGIPVDLCRPRFVQRSADWKSIESSKLAALAQKHGFFWSKLHKRDFVCDHCNYRLKKQSIWGGSKERDNVWYQTVDAWSNQKRTNAFTD